MRPVALLLRQWPQPEHQALAAFCETRLLMPGADVQADFFRDFNKDVSILCSSLLDTLDTALLEALPNLRLVAHLGQWQGDSALLEARGIQLLDSGDAGMDEAADFALTQILVARRRFGLPLLETGAKRTLDQGLGSSVRGICLGLLGFDAAAAALAQRAQALQMQVCCWTPADNQLPTGITRLATREALARQADAISLHQGVSTSPAPVVDDIFLAACKTDAVLVNITDSRLINEEALVHHLRDYGLGAAALDVCEDPALLAGCPNLVVTERLATNTAQARTAMAQVLVQGIQRYVATAEAS